MTLKTPLLALFLTCAGLSAQTPPPAFPEVPANTPTDTNRQEQLRQAMRQARMNRTNAVVPSAAATSNAPGTSPAVPSPFMRPAQPAVPALTQTNVPTAPGMAAPTPAPTPATGTPPPARAPGDLAIPPSPATNAPTEELIPQGMIDFRGADLNQVLQIYADLVNRTILRPANLPAPQQIVLQTRGTLTRREAIQALDSVLQLNGITMANIGDKFVKALPAAQAGQSGAPFNTLPADQLPELGQYITHVVQLTYSKPSEVMPALQPFASGVANPIVPIESSQILVLRDSTENVKRMLEMIKKIDVSVPSEYISEVIPIKYALSSDIANALNSLSSGGGGTTVGGGTTAGGTRTTAGGYRGTTGTRTGTGYPGSMQGTSPFGTPGMTPQATTPGAVGGSFTERLQNIIKRASVSGEIQVLGQTKIIADERTNSLLIFASREDMKMIKDIVAKLDVVLAQVLIEAVVIEVSLGNNRNLGISYLEKQPHGGNYFMGQGAINNGTLLSPNNFVLSGATNATGNVPGGFNYLATLGNDLDISITAVASDSRAKILQRPRIQTSHAVPAVLFVGESRPYPTSSYYGGGAFGGYSSIQQLQIGVTLEVTPLINPDGLVVMDIHQKIESFKGNVLIQNVGNVPITSSKDATAKVAVRDHDTIMLGGLIEDARNQSGQGVPFLKDIPGLGYLFRSSTKEASRSELIVLIRPTVLPTPEVAALTARAEKDRMPEVKLHEKEVQTEEAKRLKQADKAYYKR